MQAKIIQITQVAQAPAKESKPLITPETFHSIMEIENSGRALALYCFYAKVAGARDEGQPYCTDNWTAIQLDWNRKTVSEKRRALVKAGVIKMIRKGKHQYIQIQFLPFTVSNKNNSTLSTDNLSPGVMGTVEVFSHYAKWYDRIQGKPTRFINTVRKQSGSNTPQDQIMQYLEGTYAKINATGYGIERVDNELSFFHYLVAGVCNKIKNLNRTRTKRKPKCNT